MEINKYSDILGVVVQEPIAEGRMVVLTPNAAGTVDFGSRGDLPGVRYANSATEAGRAYYIVTFTAPDQTMPMYVPSPSIGAFSLRHGGFDQAGNLPLDPSAVHMTWPGQKEGLTIPSGSMALAFGGGVFTVPSGSFIYSTGLSVGEYLVVSAAGDTDDGKLKWNATATNAVAVVERFELDDMKLTFRSLQP